MRSGLKTLRVFVQSWNWRGRLLEFDASLPPELEGIERAL